MKYINWFSNSFFGKGIVLSFAIFGIAILISLFLLVVVALVSDEMIIISNYFKLGIVNWKKITALFMVISLAFSFIAND